MDCATAGSGAVPPAHSEIQQLRDGRYMQVNEHRTGEGDCISIRTDVTDVVRQNASFQLLFENNPVPMLVCEHATLRISAGKQGRFGTLRTRMHRSLPDQVDFRPSIPTAGTNTVGTRMGSFGGRRNAAPACQGASGRVMDVSVYFQRPALRGAGRHDPCGDRP